MLGDSPYMTPQLEQWRRHTDGPLLIIAVASLPILLLELERSQLPPVDRLLIDIVNVVVLVAFAVDYVVELRLASDRRAYVRQEWVNAAIVIACAIAVIPQLAAFGGARLARAGPAVRGLTAMLRLLAVGGVAAREGRRLIRRRAVGFASDDGSCHVVDGSRCVHARRGRGCRRACRLVR